MKHWIYPLLLSLTLISAFSATLAEATEPPAVPSIIVDDLQLHAGIREGQTTFTIHGSTGSERPFAPKVKTIYSAHITATGYISAKRIEQSFDIIINPIQGELTELQFELRGHSKITSVKTANLESWSLRQDLKNKQKRLVITLSKTPKLKDSFDIKIQAEHAFDSLPTGLEPIAIFPNNEQLFDGSLRLDYPDSLAVKVTKSEQLTPLKLPNSDQIKKPLYYAYTTTPYTLKLTIAESEKLTAKISDFLLSSNIQDERASFTLKANAHVHSADSPPILALKGRAALTAHKLPSGATILFRDDAYWLKFNKPGTFPIHLTFDTKINRLHEKRSIEFETLNTHIRPIKISGLNQDTAITIANTVPPTLTQNTYHTFLPESDPIKIQWKPAEQAKTSQLFYAADGIEDIYIGAGILRQNHLLNLHVTQGELRELSLVLKGDAEVTDVQGEGILNWNIFQPKDALHRSIGIRFNQANTQNVSIKIVTQTPLPNFPTRASITHIIPDQAIRYGGFLRIVHDSTVRLSTENHQGLAQISPQQFPQEKQLRSFNPESQHILAFRFSSKSHTLDLQVDHVLPEISVSQLLHYTISESNITLSANIELDIRDAPLRELNLKTPKDYAISQIDIAGLSDYFVQPQSADYNLVQLIFSTPLTQRQILKLRLESNETFNPGDWTAPTIEVLSAQNTRGHIGLSASPGIRLSNLQSEHLIETSAAYFPIKLENLQLTYRLRAADWSLKIKHERLPRTIQVDALHLYTIGEGVVYHSSVINYLVSGAPVSTFSITSPNKHDNVEFTGHDIREWKTTDDGYEVRLHTPISGTYTLLMTSETQFDQNTIELDFIGIIPAEAANDQGNVVVVSHYPLKVIQENLSGAVIPIEMDQIPADYRLLFDAPVLTAYQYTTRPFSAQLQLSPYTGTSMTDQIVDRSSIKTKITATGEVLTNALYYAKSKGKAHFNLTLPANMRIWSAHVDGKKVTAVADGLSTTALPIPQHNDPNKLIKIELKLACVFASTNNMELNIPSIHAPVLHTQWSLSSESGYQLKFIEGSLTPVTQPQASTGLDWFSLYFQSHGSIITQVFFLLTAASILVSCLLVRVLAKQERAQSRLRKTMYILLISFVWLITFFTWNIVFQNTQTNPWSTPSPIIFNPSIQAPDNQVTATMSLESINQTYWLQTWPCLIGIALWLYVAFATFRKITMTRALKTLCIAIGWSFVALGSLNTPNGISLFLWVLFAFVFSFAVIPSIRHIIHFWPSITGNKTIVNCLLLACVLAAMCFPQADTHASSMLLPNLYEISEELGGRSQKPVARIQEEVVHDDSATFRTLDHLEQILSVEGNAIHVETTAQVKTEAGERIVLLRSPAVLSSLSYDTSSIKYISAVEHHQKETQLEALKSGTHTIHFSYKIIVQNCEDTLWQYVQLPTPSSITHRAVITIDKKDIAFTSDQAVTVTPTASNDLNQSQASLILQPSNQTIIQWRPKSRDASSEATVFYAEQFQLTVPNAGVVVNHHHVRIRLTQGQVHKLEMNVPPNLTITDVQFGQPHNWQFDPQTNALNLYFQNELTANFEFVVISESPTEPLPYKQKLSPLHIEAAENQFGLIGIATSDEIHLNQAESGLATPLNLQSFPAEIISHYNRNNPQHTLRRVFRYHQAEASVDIAVQAVEPDIRMLTQENLSVSEDRNVLAVAMHVNIARTGVFQLRLALPDKMDVESLSGATLSHWNELSKTDSQRVIVLHLKQKTIGDCTFNITLTGQGLADVTTWKAPKLLLMEANKQSGQLNVTPEQGIRLYVQSSTGLIQEDPKKQGIHQKGVLTFRLYNPQWDLQFEVEKVDPWIEVETLQNILMREGLSKIEAEFKYSIENAGIKTLYVQLPEHAVGVRFRGKHLADTLPAPDHPPGTWVIKLHRRIIGPYTLKAFFELVNRETPLQGSINGIGAVGANTQRNYLILRQKSRLKIATQFSDLSLIPIEWQSLPPDWTQEIHPNEFVSAFRIQAADFNLDYTLIRRKAEKSLLPAQVQSVHLKTVVSETGDMLTETRIQLNPGNERFLKFQLPDTASLWFAFVNKQSTWTWADETQLLIPLEENSKEGEPTSVVFYHSMPYNLSKLSKIRDAVAGPQFDLPLEAIGWQIYLPSHWDVNLDKLGGNVKLVQTTPQTASTFKGLDDYISSEKVLSSAQTQDANDLLDMGNRFLQKGQQGKARDAFEAAYNLSQSDAAFNEDARVQFHGLRQRQATVGLANRLNTLRNREQTEDTYAHIRLDNQALDFTEQQASQVLNDNSAEVNEVLNQLADRIIQQQTAILARPQAIRANLPEQGQQLTFERPLLVDNWKELFVQLYADGQSSGSRFNAIIVFVCMSLFFVVAMRLIGNL